MGTAPPKRHLYWEKHPPPTRDPTSLAARSLRPSLLIDHLKHWAGINEMHYLHRKLRCDRQ